LAFILMEWLKPRKSQPFYNKPLGDQLAGVADATQRFEDTYLGSDFFTKRIDYNPEHRNLYSAFLRKLSTSRLWSERSPDVALEKANSLIVAFAQGFSRRPVVSMNDGLAPASTSAAIVAALLFKDLPLVSALQKVYYYGADTDTVGAMLGSLLGAYAGASGKKIPESFCCHLMCAENLFDCFRMFISHRLSKERPEGLRFDFVHQEHLVTNSVLSVPNGKRNAHYNVHHSYPVAAHGRGEVYQEVQEQVERMLVPYARMERKNEIETMFTVVYRRIFMSEFIMEKAFGLSGDDRKQIFSDSWIKVVVPAFVS